MDWKSKLTSRKFWLALAAFVTGLILAFGGSQDMATTVSGCIMSGAAVVAYIFGEGLVDSAGAGSATTSTIVQASTTDPDAVAKIAKTEDTAVVDTTSAEADKKEAIATAASAAATEATQKVIDAVAQAATAASTVATPTPETVVADSTAPVATPIQ